jgi:hypothetical protein
MFKFIIIIFLLCYGFSSNTVKAQGAGMQIFEITCDAIAQQNERFLVNRSLEGVAFLVEDPVTGERDIMFRGDTTTDAARNFRKLNMAGQLEILMNKSLPVFPLTDSLLIIDTLKFFSAGLNYRSGRYFFKVIRRADERNKNARVIYLSALGNLPANRRKEQFYLCFAFPGHRLWSYYYFTRGNGLYTICRTSLDDDSYCSGG